MARIYQPPYNQEYVIKAAKDGGYTVSGIPTYEQRQDCIAPQVLMAADLDTCLAYIKQEIVKHDEWRNPGPSK